MISSVVSKIEGFCAQEAGGASTRIGRGFDRARDARRRGCPGVRFAVRDRVPAQRIDAGS